MTEYDFRALSPTDFERMVGDLLNADLGLRLHSYPEGRDQGIDLRQVTPDGTTTIVQCKHYVKSGRATFLTAVRGEVDKPARRMAHRYLFVTSRELSPGLQDEVAGILDATVADVWGRHALNDALGRNPDVERRHFKLWLSSTAALETIINAGRWQRSEALLADVAERAKYWVGTPAYAAVGGILEREGVCVVTGPPGAGKTFLAEMIALRAAYDGWQIIQLADEVEEAWDSLRPDSMQLFIYDDFLGQAELKATAASEAKSLVNFVAHVRRLRQCKRLIVTSREQVLSQAASAASDGLRQLTCDPPRYTVAPSAYGSATRAEILFNHLYFSALAPGEHDRLAVDSRMMTIVGDPSYSPRVVAAVTARIPQQATADEVLDRIILALGNPDELWAVSFDVLTPLAKAIILALATMPPHPVPHAELRYLTEATGSVLDWKAALKSLEPTWVKVTRSEANKPVSFSNPGCRDYVLGRLDDVDLAEEQLGRLKRLRQLVSLSLSAGLLAADSHSTTSRQNLSQALMSHRRELAQVARLSAEEDLGIDRSMAAVLKTLRDAACLLSIYGSADTSDWLLERISLLASDDRIPACLPTADALALASRLQQVPATLPAVRDDLVARLIQAALASARTTRDLDSYEALPDRLRTSDVHKVASRRAAEIIDVELSVLTDNNTDPDVIRETALDLQHRAQWYGHEIHIHMLLEHADELAAHGPGQAGGGWPSGMQSGGDPDEDPASASDIFSRFGK
jgi:hypothetical protein